MLMADNLRNFAQVNAKVKVKQVLGFGAETAFPISRFKAEETVSCCGSLDQVRGACSTLRVAPVVRLCW